MNKNQSYPIGTLKHLVPKNPIMIAAWLGSLHYSLSNTDILTEFLTSTGNSWELGHTAIDRMIDESSGAQFEFFRAFVKWHNENIWGEEDDKPIDADVAQERNG